MGARLVGHDVGGEVVAQQAGQHLRGVADEADRQRPPLALGGQAAGDRVVVGVGDDVEVAGLDPAVGAPRVDLDAQRHAVVHRDRQRLRTSHPAEPGGDGDRARQGAAEALAGDLGEALVGALQDPLRADVDPRPGGHLAVHREPGVLEAAELVPVGPLGHEVGVGEQHPRRPLVGAHHPDRLAALHEQRLVVGERRERAADRVEGVPRPRRPPGAAVHDEIVGSLGDLRIEVVLQHPVGGLLRPRPAGERRAARGADGAGTSHRRRRYPRRAQPAGSSFSQAGMRVGRPRWSTQPWMVTAVAAATSPHVRR